MINFLHDLLNLYLLPFMLAVPLAIVVLLVTTRRGDHPTDEPAARQGRDGKTRVAPAAAEAAPAAAAAVGAAAVAPRPAAAPAATAQALLPKAGSLQAPTQALPLQTAPMPPEDPPTLLDAQPLPLQTRPAAPATCPAQPLPQRSVLVVDDSAVARAKLRKLFESAGYRVEVARDGVEALERLAVAFYSVMITDLEMPNMDGVELIAAVQGSIATEDLPIIAITGHESLQARVQDCQGLFGIFKKPWPDRELLKRVASLAAMREPVHEPS